MPRLFRTFLTLCVVALAAAFVFAACNDDDDGGDDNGGDTSGVPELEDGVLNVGSAIAY
ncbi:MAG: amino acid ABC transporter substrate-binding protein, partial [Chloroflexi bacterium]|nr:amino acid ABC transporter substrate-binding protein [Chloroflexota bacterium]